MFMSKYSELCESFASAYVNYRKYESDCNELALVLWKYMVDYFEIPQEQITLYRINELGEFEPCAFPMLNAMLLREDAFFEIGIGLTLYQTMNDFPHETIILPIHFSIDTEGFYKTRLGEEGKIYVVEISKVESFDEFFHGIYENIVQSYKTGLSDLRSKNTFRKIGFK